MQSAALHFAPILGAEKSKVPFYIAGGLLVAWALIVSLGLGMRRPDFPGGQSGQRVVAMITAVLVIAAASTAVITSAAPAKGAVAAATAAPTTPNAPAAPAPAASTPTASTPTASTPTASTPKSSPKATTGTPKATTGTPKATTGTPAPASSPAAPAGKSTLKLAADPGGQLSYDTKHLSAKAGKVAIDFANTSPLEHNVTIAQGSSVLGATPVFIGGSKTVTLNLKPGTYTFYCSVPGHRQAGMEGTLTVS